MIHKGIEDAFSLFDEDGNGRIDQDEFGELMGTLGAEMSEEELEMSFEFIDRDGNGYIDMQEFADWWEEAR